MENSRFDRWTRRRFGQAAGSALGATLIGIPMVATAGKKKKKKKKKGDCLQSGCVPVDGTCNPYGSPCCDCNTCTKGSDGFYSCRA